MPDQVVKGEGLPKLTMSALWQAMPIPVERPLVDRCLDPISLRDDEFRRAWLESMAGKRSARLPGSLSPTTGHVAESITSAILNEFGFELIWQLTGPGAHGVDLIMLDPAGSNLVAWEVKGTLRRSGLPRLRGRERRQMGEDWLDKADNPGMAEWKFRSGDVLGGIAVVRFPQMELRLAVTGDYLAFVPIRDIDMLADLSWAWS